MNSLSSQFRDLIWGRILRQEYKPGEQIPTKEIAEEFNVSVTPIRLALKELADNGFLFKRARVGYFVVDLTSAELIEISQTRRMFEVYCLSNFFNGLDLEKLHKTYKIIYNNKVSNFSKQLYQGSDKAFHNALVQASANRYLMQQYQRVNDMFATFVAIDANNTENIIKSRNEHLEILDHIFAGEKEPAIQGLNLHLDRADELLMSNYFCSKGHDKPVFGV